VDVRSDRRYQLGLAPEDLWPLLTRVEDYRRWWPWLRLCDARGFEEGATWRCVVQPPLPYTIQFDLTLTEVEPHRWTTAEIRGDIIGTASIDLRPNDGGTEVRLVSHLAPANPFLRTIAVVARPVVQRGHDWVLDTGWRQFRSKAVPVR
jgi:uncharacterized protein YndB with AHSA1/START domain